MTGQQALDRIMARCGNRTSQVLRANALAEMAMIQENLELGQLLPWWLIANDQALGVVANARTVATPTGFIREIDEQAWRLFDSGVEHELVKKDYKELNTLWGSAATASLPQNYALLGGLFYVFPIPTADLSGSMSFYKKQPAPTDDAAATDAWLVNAPDLLIGETGVVIASQYLKDTELAGIFAALQTKAWMRINFENTARAEANRDRNMG